MIPRSAALALLLSISAASACSGGRTFDDPSQPIEVRAGSEFTIALESNQSTGYRWVLVDSATLGPLRVAGTTYGVVRLGSDAGMVPCPWSRAARSAGPSTRRPPARASSR